MPDYTRNSSLLDWRDSPRLWFGNFPMSGWTVYDPVLLHFCGIFIGYSRNYFRVDEGGLGATAVCLFWR